MKWFLSLSQSDHTLWTGFRASSQLGDSLHQKSNLFYLRKNPLLQDINQTNLLPQGKVLKKVL